MTKKTFSVFVALGFLILLSFLVYNVYLQQSWRSFLPVKAFYDELQSPASDKPSVPAKKVVIGGVDIGTFQVNQDLNKALIITITVESDQLNETNPVVPNILGKMSFHASGAEVNLSMPAELTSRFSTRPATVVSTSSSSSVLIQATSAIMLTTVQQPPFYMCTGYNGRLGNLMFEMATSFSLAFQKHMVLVVPPDLTPRQLFTLNSSVNISSDVSRCTGAVHINTGKCCTYNSHLLDQITGKENVQVDGFLQVYKYFDSVKPEIRRLFTLNDFYKNKSRDIILKAMTSHYNSTLWTDRTLVGVHVRRGDFTNSDKIKFGHTTASREYIIKAMSYFDSKFPNVTFIICSDDTKWVKENVHHPHAIVMEGNSDIQDFAILVQTDHMVVTTGTFGWWAAWMVNGTTVYYKDFLVPGTDLANEFNPGATDYIPPNWMPL